MDRAQHEVELRHQEAEQAFERVYHAVRVWALHPQRLEADLETIASEMGVSDYYKQIRKE